MRYSTIVAGLMVCMTSVSAYSAEKSKVLSQIDAVHSVIEGMAVKAGDNKEAAGDLERARASLKKAEEAYENGRQMFGFGDIKPESEQEIKHHTGMAELAVSLAGSRLEKLRAEVELAALDKQLALVKAKVKIFDDRKSEVEKLKAEAAKFQVVSKELEATKSEKALLSSQVEMLMAESARLKEQLEKVQVENKTIATQLEEARKGGAKQVTPETSSVVKEPVKESAPPKEIPAAIEVPAVKEKPAVKEPPAVKETPAKEESVPVVPKGEGAIVPIAGEAAPAAPEEKK